MRNWFTSPRWPKERRTIPENMSWNLIMLSAWHLSVIRATLKEGGFPRLSAARSSEKNEAQDCGKLFKKRRRHGETGSKAECFPWRRRITGLKCVNSEVNSVGILPNGFPQVGPWHHVGATMEITLDKKLIHHRISWELNPIHAKPNKTERYLKNDIWICIYIYIDIENHISLWQ